MTDTQPPTDQPDGIDPYEFELPDPVRAAKRVERFLQAYGDGIVAVRVSPEYQETMPPLYARDLEVLRKVATADAARLTPESPALRAGDVVEVWEQHSPRQAPIRRGTVKTLGNTTGPLVIILEGPTP